MKWFLLLVLNVATICNGFADVISCPTSLDSYYVNGKNWTIILKLDVGRYVFSGEYSPVTKKISPYTYDVIIIDFHTTNHYSLNMQNGIMKLTCDGNYILQKKNTNIFMFWMGETETRTNTFRAELSLNLNDYKTCIPSNSDTFDCTK